nr:reverse transcriptase domain-containing protein [Tanacetum cinerariifolium]
MSTRSTSSNLFSPLRDPKSLIRRRNLGEPSSLFDFEEVMSIPHNNQEPPLVGPLPPQNNNGPAPVVRPNGPAPQSMEELCQPSINGRGGPIAPIPIQATDFGLRDHMIQQVQNSCQFHGLPGDEANRHIDKFLEITQYMKQNGVSDDALRLSLFSYSLTHHATTWHQDTINAAAGGTFMQKTPKECYNLIENMTAHHNHLDTSATRDETSRTIFLPLQPRSAQSSVATLKRPLMLLRVTIIRGVIPTNHKMKMQSPLGSGSLPSNTIANPRGDVKAITTRSGESYYHPKVVECETKATKDKVQNTSSESASINLMLLSVWKKLYLPDLTSTRLTLELATRSYAYRADRPFLRTARSLVDVYGEELILRDGDEQLIFHADNTSKKPHKHGNESINMINFIDNICEDQFPKVLKFKKSNHPSSGSTTPLSDSSPSLTPFEISDSLLEEFIVELALLDPFRP